MLYIPAGVAHGFLTLSDLAIFSYKCTDFYSKATIENLGDPRICDGCGRFNEECSCG
mgnify:CR=1 FL=1